MAVKRQNIDRYNLLSGELSHSLGRKQKSAWIAL